MRRRLPSPALVIASIALFVALGGAGFAASLALVKAPKPTTVVAGSMSANGKLIGGLAHGTERSTGVYTLTINGNWFARNGPATSVQSLVTPHTITIVGTDRVLDPTCDTSGGTLAPDGTAKFEVDCFTFDPAAGWQPASAAFDFQVLGPSR